MRLLFVLMGLIWLAAAGAMQRNDSSSVHTKSQHKTVQLSFRTFLDQLNQIPDIVVTTSRKSNKHIHMERANDLAKNLYSLKRRAQADDLHTVVIAIKQRNMETLERILYEVSDPRSEKYGQHMTNKEIEELTASHESTSYVIDYLQQNDITDIKQTPHGDYITATAPIRVFEKMLNCEFHVYGARDHEDFVITRTSNYFLEEHVVEHVATIFHTVHFPPTHHLDHYHKRKSLGELHTAANLAGYVTPKVLKDLYNIDITLGNSRTSQAVYESIGQTMSASDLTYFQHYFNLTVQAVSTVIGGHSSDRTCKQNPDDCVEANLDVQYMMAIAPHVPTTYYYWGGEDFMVDWLMQVAAMHNPPKVISISYGMDEQYLTTSYASSFNTQAIKVGVQGVTLIASSGDDGAPGSGARSNSFMCGYHPSFPASSPYVTAIGGTMGPENGQEETACQSDHGGIITTGGGFSYLYDMPSWQRAHVQAYHATVEGSEQQPLLGFNMHGRGFPDVSALAYNYIISVGNQLTAVSGTSASSPVFAGMVSLVNSARLEAGHSNLGWLNPALYQYSSSFVRDITSGDNRCGADAMVCCGHGYFATDGWDPVTGLGAIDFPSFKDTMMSIGVPERVPSLTPTRAPQGPTIHPTRSPALAPTAHPTAAPTMQKGWLYISQYESESCEGRVATMSAVPTDTCLELYGSDQKIAGSVHYVCRGDGTAMVSYYSDATCRKVKQESSIFMGCAYKVANYYDSEEYFSTEVSCTMSSDPTTPPLPAYDGSYGVERSYNSLFGCEGQVSAVEAVLQDYCFNINQRVMSYKLIFPNIVVYDALDCKASKQVSQNPLNLDCKFAIEADDDGFNDDEFGNDGSKLRDAVTMKKGSSLYKQKVDTSMAFDNIHSSQGFTPRGPVKAVRQLNNVELQGDDYYGDDAITDMFNIWAVADVAPLDGASEEPSLFPTHRPTTLLPTMGPLATHLPTYTPTSCLPIVVPTILPSSLPTSVPVHTEPTAPPFGSGNDSSAEPSYRPSVQPTIIPTPQPTLHTNKPSASPQLSTQAPSITPTAFPTLMPISVDPLASNISITLQHVLSGISMDGWRNSVDKNVAVLIYAVTTSLALKSSSSVVFVSATDLAPAMSANVAASTSQLQVKYKVLIDMADTSYSTVPSAMQSVQTTMANDVAQGKFDDLLHRYAAAMQSSSLMMVSSKSVAVVGVDEVTGSDPEQEDRNPKDSTSGASAAVIVTVVLLIMALTILCSTVRWNSVKSLFGRSSGQSLYSHVSLNSDSLHGSMVPRRPNSKVADEDADVDIELSTLPTHVQPPVDKAYVKGKIGDDIINPMAADTAAV